MSASSIGSTIISCGGVVEAEEAAAARQQQQQRLVQELEALDEAEQFVFGNVCL